MTTDEGLIWQFDRISVQNRMTRCTAWACRIRRRSMAGTV